MAMKVAAAHLEYESEIVRYLLLQFALEVFAVHSLFPAMPHLVPNLAWLSYDTRVHELARLWDGYLMVDLSPFRHNKFTIAILHILGRLQMPHRKDGASCPRCSEVTEI